MPRFPDSGKEDLPLGFVRPPVVGKAAVRLLDEVAGHGRVGPLDVAVGRVIASADVVADDVQAEFPLFLPVEETGGLFGQVVAVAYPVGPPAEA